MATDKQSARWQLTINNPQNCSMEHQNIKETLIDNFPTLDYFCMADEIGVKEKTPHTHIFICFTSRVRFSKVKKYFPTSHIEKVKGSIKDNIHYVQKSGKWSNDPKADTKIDGTFEEWGTPPPEKGKHIDMQDLYDMVESGMSNAEILKENKDYILHIEKIDKLRTTLLADKYSNYRRVNLKVTYIQGSTGTGKTRGVLDEHGDGNVHIANDLRNPWDSYDSNRHTVVFFDEFRNSFALKKMLQWLDIYASTYLEARYAPKLATFERVYIASNWELEQQYEEEKRSDPESYNAWLRRIHEVKVYDADGTITIYDSVEKYLHRNDAKFEPVPQQLEIPFTEEE